MAEEKQPRHIAFYGTLKAGSEHYVRLGLGAHLKPLGTCEIKGDLYDIESPHTLVKNFPALVPGAGVVKAQLFEILDTSFFPRMDEYETIRPNDPSSFYRREALPLHQPAGIEVWVYVYNQSIEGRLKIESGDWTAHIAEKQTCALAKPPRP